MRKREVLRLLPDGKSARYILVNIKLKKIYVKHNKVNIIFSAG